MRYKNWKFTYYGSQPGATGRLLPLIPYLARTEAYVISRRERKKVEILFAHLKRILRLDRLRLRGPNGAKRRVPTGRPALHENDENLIDEAGEPVPRAI